MAWYTLLISCDLANWASGIQWNFHVSMPSSNIARDVTPGGISKEGVLQVRCVDIVEDAE
eukprot:10857128-Ditylum_brightwellii.AAC.1